MKEFKYNAAQTLGQAKSALHEHGSDATILAGGTDLLIEWRRATGSAPKVVVDISRIDELKGIATSNGEVIINPLTTHTQIVNSSILREYAPLLSSAAATVGSPQIRNRGTVGGNIMNAATCADLVPPLIALDATVTLGSTEGARQLGLVDLFIKPYRTRASSEEVLTQIRFPKLSSRARSSFIKLGRRNALSISRLSVAAILEQDDDGRITDARIVPGAAFPTWQRVHEAEQMLVQEKPTKELFIAVGKKVSEEMISSTGRRWSTEYKEPVVAVLVRRGLEQCVRPQFNRAVSV